MWLLATSSRDLDHKHFEYAVNAAKHVFMEKAL